MTQEPTKPNRRALRMLMAEHDLRNQDVADMLERSVDTVNAWTSPSRPEDIPNQLLELLQFKTASKY